MPEVGLYSVSLINCQEVKCEKNEDLKLDRLNIEFNAINNRC